MTSNAGPIADDTASEIARLREQLDGLLRDHVTPALNSASAALGDKADALSGKVRDQPLTALLIAAAAGFLLGRAMR